MSGHGELKLQSKSLQWFERRLPVLSFVHSSFVAYPTPRNLNYWWTFGAILAVMLAAVLDEDPVRARDAARAWIAPYCRSVNYQASLAEQGFEPADWEPPYADRLLDAIVAWGGPGELARRVSAMHAAGADHVAVIPLAPDGSTEHLPVLEALAPHA